MNAGARARSRSAYVPPPRPVQVVAPRITEQKKPKKSVEKTPSGPVRKTHTGVVIKSTGQQTVSLRETATVWTSGSKENYDKQTGHRVGTRGRCRLLLETIKPIENTTADKPASGTQSLTAQQLVAVMKGKTLTYQAILASVRKHYPDAKITMDQLQRRVFAMVMSSYVGMTRHDDMPVTHFTLTSVDPRFYTHSEKNANSRA